MGLFLLTQLCPSPEHPLMLAAGELPDARVYAMRGLSAEPQRDALIKHLGAHPLIRRVRRVEQYFSGFQDGLIMEVYPSYRARVADVDGVLCRAIETVLMQRALIVQTLTVSC